MSQWTAVLKTVHIISTNICVNLMEYRDLFFLHESSGGICGGGGGVTYIRENTVLTDLMIQQGIVPYQVVPHFSCFFFYLYQFHSTINKHISVSFSFLYAPVHLLAGCKHVCRYPLGMCNTFSSFKYAALHGMRAEPAEDSTLFACFACETA